jgi:hypothetical protein
VIISASRRTDIPAFYAGWFERRLRAGRCTVPNPFNPKQVATVSLSRQDVDAFVFWTRNPLPFLPLFDLLDRRSDVYVVLFTLTGYGPPLEPDAPPASEAVAAFHRLSERIGAERVVWRYDPVILGPGLDAEAHVERFAGLASSLAGATRAVKVSFIDLYRKTRRRLLLLERGEEYLQDPISSPELGRLVRGLGQVARDAGLEISTCGEERDLSSWGVPPGSCIDASQLSKLCGKALPAGKDPGQRRHCRCAPSKDIGMTDSCLHGCVYCYATSGQEVARQRAASHDPTSSSLLPLQG